ncbi:MAG TPA: hypothetical protein VNM72_01135 [Blastocatellia bacterium]|nr:hypothetical protein [Blastocatellia bacterium]
MPDSKDWVVSGTERFISTTRRVLPVKIKQGNFRGEQHVRVLTIKPIPPVSGGPDVPLRLE